MTIYHFYHLKYDETTTKCQNSVTMKLVFILTLDINIRIPSIQCLEMYHVTHLIALQSAMALLDRGSALTQIPFQFQYNVIFSSNIM